MTSGDLVAFFTAFFLMTNPVRLLNDTHMKLSQASGAAERIFEVLNWKSNVPEAAIAQPVPRLQKGIQFQNVTFAYPDSPEHPVLHDVSFEIPRGKVTALVGESGSGKTSIASLLPRLFDVSKGTIRWEGVPLPELDLQELRANISVVSQDVFLFNDTVEENIRCGRRDATREEIREAARRAQALAFIEKMPQGFNTIVGDRGQKLSGGERQRLSMARAFLRPSPLLILDEATSNLDTKSEKLVQDTLTELMRDRTTLVIAHRLSTVRHADQILLIRDGRIAEEGNHEALLQKGGRYAELFQS
jgi:subfamily B ATP-binding cassette protein MsbA